MVEKRGDRVELLAIAIAEGIHFGEEPSLDINSLGVEKKDMVVAVVYVHI